jgi:hypothetical protein
VAGADPRVGRVVGRVGAQLDRARLAAEGALDHGDLEPVAGRRGAELGGGVARGLERDHPAAAEPAQPPRTGQGVDADVGADVDDHVPAAQLAAEEGEHLGLVGAGVVQHPLQVVAQVQLQPQAEAARADQRRGGRPPLGQPDQRRRGGGGVARDAVHARQPAVAGARAEVQDGGGQGAGTTRSEHAAERAHAAPQQPAERPVTIPHPREATRARARPTRSCAATAPSAQVWVR